MLNERVDDIIKRALEEDIGAGDITTEATVSSEAVASGSFRSKASGIVSGTNVATRVFELLGGRVSLEWLAEDGTATNPGEVIGRISGNARSILTGERTALNILQRMSGIATATERLVSATAGTSAVILDTRKTAPGLRILDKIAVRHGGGHNHRWGLYDMVLIKDNHIVAAGGVSNAIARARKTLDDRSEHIVKIEVEARTLSEVADVVAHLEATGDPDRILLDNMVRVGMDGTIDTSMLERAVSMVAGRLETEASGNVTEKTVAAIAATGVDYISAGSLTHSVTALDISLELDL